MWYYMITSARGTAYLLMPKTNPLEHPHTFWGTRKKRKEKRKRNRIRQSRFDCSKFHTRNGVVLFRKAGCTQRDLGVCVNRGSKDAGRGKRQLGEEGKQSSSAWQAPSSVVLIVMVQSLIFSSFLPLHSQGSAEGKQESPRSLIAHHAIQVVHVVTYMCSNTRRHPTTTSSRGMQKRR